MLNVKPNYSERNPCCVIAHIDMDCFYAQVEHRRLNIPRDVPLAVQQWDRLISVNYAARALGVKSGNNVVEACQKCPNIRFVHVEVIGEGTSAFNSDNCCIEPLHNFSGKFYFVAAYRSDTGEAKTNIGPNRNTQKVSLQRYRAASDEILDILTKHYPNCFERTSIDESYIDLTSKIESLVRELYQIIDTALSMYQLENDDKKDNEELPPVARPLELSTGASLTWVAIEWIWRWLAYIDQSYSTHFKPNENNLKHSSFGHSIATSFVQHLWSQLFSPDSHGRLALLSLHSNQRMDIVKDANDVVTSIPECRYQDFPILLGGLLIYETRIAIQDTTEFTASAGIGRNKFLPKEVSAKRKPNAQTIILDSSLEILLRNIRLREARGFRGKTGQFVASILPKTETLYDLKCLSWNDLKKAFEHCSVDDKFLLWLYDIPRGQSHSKVKPVTRVNSMLACKKVAGATKMSQLRFWIGILCEELAERLHSEYVNFKRVPKSIVIHQTGGKPIRSRTRSAPAPLPKNKADPLLRASDLINFVEKTLPKRFTFKELFPCTRLGVAVCDLHQCDSTLKITQFSSTNKFTEQPQDTKSMTCSSKKMGKRTLCISASSQHTNDNNNLTGTKNDSNLISFEPQQCQEYRRRRRRRRVRKLFLSICHYQAIHIVPQKR